MNHDEAWCFELRGRVLVRATGAVLEDCPLHLIDEDRLLRRVLFSSKGAALEYATGFAALTERVGLGGWKVYVAPVDKLRGDLPILLDPNIATQPGRHLSLYELL